MNNDIYVREWMKDCPSVQNATVKSKGGKQLEYGIYPSRVQTRYRENVLGELIAEELQEAIFIFTAKLQYFGNESERYSFYQDVINWIEEQNRNHYFPRLNEGTVKYVHSQMSQYVSEPNRTVERNEIEIRFTYKRNNS